MDCEKGKNLNLMLILKADGIVIYRAIDPQKKCNKMTKLTLKGGHILLELRAI